MKIAQYLAICFATLFFGRILANKQVPQVNVKVFGDIKPFREFLKDHKSYGSASEGTAGSKVYPELLKDWHSKNDLKGNEVKANFEGGDKASQFILNSLKSRASQLRDKLGKDGLQENNLADWKQYFRKIVGDDFKKHRQLSNIKYVFYPSNQNFAAGKKDMLLTYYRSFGGPYRRRRKGKPGRGGGGARKGIVECETTTTKPDCIDPPAPQRTPSQPDCTDPPPPEPDCTDPPPPEPDCTDPPAPKHTPPQPDCTDPPAPEPDCTDPPAPKHTPPQPDCTDPPAPEPDCTDPPAPKHTPPQPDCTDPPPPQPDCTDPPAPEPDCTDPPAPKHTPPQPDCTDPPPPQPDCTDPPPPHNTEAECETTPECGIPSNEGQFPFSEKCKTWAKCLLSLGGFVKKLIRN